MIKLGKSFDRQYNLRLPFSGSFVDIQIFFKKKSSFVLFNVFPIVDDDIVTSEAAGIKINMFKNLKQSLFCDLFIKLHSFKSDNLDIFNQFNGLKYEASNDISYILNEVIYVNKVKTDDRNMYDSLTVYAFTFNDYQNQFIFLIAERHHINTILKKKIVRTTAIQISNSDTIHYLNEFANNLKQTEISNQNKIFFD